MSVVAIEAAHNRRCHELVVALRLVLVLIAVVLVAVPMGAVSSATMTTILIQVIMVVGLQAFIGNSGVLSFGHMAFAAIGAYTAGLATIPSDVKEVLQPELPPWIAAVHLHPIAATIAGALVAGVFAALIAVPLMRLDGLSGSIASFGVLIIVNVVAANARSVTNGTAGLGGVPTTTSVGVALAWSVVIVAAVAVFQASAVCLRLQATREDRVSAMSLGIDVEPERRWAWVLSALVVGAGGALFAQQLGSFGPATFYLDLTFLTLAMLVIGGMTSLTGAVVGTLAVAAVSELLRQFEGGIVMFGASLSTPAGSREVGLALIMLAVLITRPRGLTNGREWIGSIRGKRSPRLSGPTIVHPEEQSQTKEHQ